MTLYMTCNHDYDNDNNNHDTVHDLLEGGALVDGVVLQHRLQSHHHQKSYWSNITIVWLKRRKLKHWGTKEYNTDISPIKLKINSPFYIFWLSVQNPTTTSWNHGNFGQNIFAHGMHLLLFQYIFVILLIPMTPLSSVLSIRFLRQTSPSHERHSTTSPSSSKWK